MRYQPLAYCSGRLVVKTVEDGCRAGAADRLCIENPVRDRPERSVRVPVRRDMNSLLLLKRPFIWLRRFRHRRGYGVHSPFAFDFITRVVYEHTPYYQYKELSAEQRRLVSEKGHSWACRESQKVKRLLFRLVNRAQPTFIVNVGPDSAAELYMKAAKKDTGYLHASQLDELFLERGVPVDFLYLHDYRQPSLVRAVFDVCADRVTERSVFVIEGVGYSPAMRQLWHDMRCDARAGITFDLYDLGVIFFDKSKIKQDYIVNF